MVLICLRTLHNTYQHMTFRSAGRHQKEIQRKLQGGGGTYQHCQGMFTRSAALSPAAAVVGTAVRWRWRELLRDFVSVVPKAFQELLARVRLEDERHEGPGPLVRRRLCCRHFGITERGIILGSQGGFEGARRVHQRSIFDVPS